MTDLVALRFDDCPVRVISREGEPWFILADICAVLEIVNSGNAAARLKETEKGSIRLADGTSSGGNPNVTIISEAGFYRLVLRSDKPRADKFQTWVTSKVLPAIRKTGTYGMPAVPIDLSDPAFLRSALLAYTEKVIALESANAELVPKAEAFERIADAKGSLTITAASKALQVGRDALLSFMRSNRWLYRGGDGFLGYQDKVNAGLLLHKVTSLSRDNRHDRVVEQVRVTAKGLARLATALDQRQDVAA